jgi:hypothetical protein
LEELWYDAGVDVVFTAVLARSIWSGVAYLNAYGETTAGLSSNDLEVGTLVGYKVSLSSSWFVVGDLLFQTDNLMTIELSAVYELPFGLSIGPGLGAVSNLHDGDTSLDVGLALAYSRP